MLIIEIEKRHNKMVDRIRWDTVSYLPFYYVFFLLLTIFNLQANILTTKDILSNLANRFKFKRVKQIWVPCKFSLRTHSLRINFHFFHPSHLFSKNEKKCFTVISIKVFFAVLANVIHTPSNGRETAKKTINRHKNTWQPSV